MDCSTPEFTMKEPEGLNVMKLTKILNDLREELPVQIKLSVEMAKLTRARYKALIDSGFSKTEALQLCK